MIVSFVILILVPNIKEQFAIGDEELLRLVNEGYDFISQPIGERDLVLDEMKIRGRSQHLHTRISQLLEKATQ